MSLDHRLLPFSRGFLLTREELDSVVHFEQTRLPGGWSLWGDAGVRSERADGSGVTVVIRGHWADLHEDASAGLAEQLMQAWHRGEVCFHEYLNVIAGRFVVVLVAGESARVYHDPLGVRSVYYHAGRPRVASHLQLLLQDEEPTRLLEDKPALGTWDLTPFAGARQLLPNFWLDPASATVTRYYPTPKGNRFLSASAEERLSRVETLWQRQLDAYASTHPQTVMSLTGGADSRLMLAMAGKSTSGYATFTYAAAEARSPWTRSLHQDGKIVRQLLPLTGVSAHTFLQVDPKPKVPKDLRRVASMNSWTEHGHFLLPQYREHFPGSDWLHIRGNGVEVVRRYWPRHPGMSDRENVMARIGKGDADESRARYHALGYEHDYPGFELMDLAYWEVRMGKWHSEVVNESDVAFDSLLPIGVREILELLLAFDERERQEGFAMRELINRQNPVLNFIGMNDTRNLYEQVRDRGRDDWVRLRGHTLRKASGHPARYPEPRGAHLCIPKEAFSAGTSATAIIHVMGVDGDLQFTVRNGYESAGLGVFEWSVVLDSDQVITCDGAASGMPARVTLRNVRKGQVVKLRLTALRDAKKSSWQAASVTSAHELTEFPRDHVGTLQAACDSPHAVGAAETAAMS